jgi:hypothetical protein
MSNEEIKLPPTDVFVDGIRSYSAEAVRAAILADRAARPEAELVASAKHEIARLKDELYYYTRTANPAVTNPEKHFRTEGLFDGAGRPVADAGETCPICCATEPRTGTCGSDDPRALCNRAAPSARMLDKEAIRAITRAVRYLRMHECSGPAADLESLLAATSAPTEASHVGEAYLMPGSLNRTMATFSYDDDVKPGAKLYISAPIEAPNCGACRGDGSTCATACKLAAESPTVAPSLTPHEADIERMLDEDDQPAEAPSVREALRNLLGWFGGYPAVIPEAEHHSAVIEAISAANNALAGKPEALAGFKMLSDPEIDAIADEQETKYGQLCDAEDLRMLVRTALRAATLVPYKALTEAPSVRDQALEEAARECDHRASNWRSYENDADLQERAESAEICADAIRALAGKPK